MHTLLLTSAECLNVTVVFNPDAQTFSSHRETNSGQRGVWVYEIGTYPYFSIVVPGEVTDFPLEAEPQATSQSVHIDRQVKYIPYEPDEGQIQILPVQYQPRQPQNPEVVVVDDTDINVDGESMRARFR